MPFVLLAAFTKRFLIVHATSLKISRFAAFGIARNEQISVNMPKAKRKSSTIARETTSLPADPMNGMPPPKRQARAKAMSMDPAKNPEIIDGPKALRASPDATGKHEQFNIKKARGKKPRVKEESDDVPSLIEDASTASPVSDIPDAEPPPPKSANKAAKPPKVPKSSTTPAVKKESKSEFADPEAEDEEEVDEEEVKEALSRPPPVNSEYLPLPWKGRLGYACLNTYLRFSNPPIFSSRTCRIASILENRHPLQHLDEPPHPTKNRPDKDQPADVARGQAYVASIGLANARDIVKMVKWNDRYGIKFMRLSSEMFPFASHEEYGYKLAPFASGTLAEAGKVIAELGHRATTHPGQVRLYEGL